MRDISFHGWQFVGAWRVRIAWEDEKAAADFLKRGDGGLHTENGKELPGVFKVGASPMTTRLQGDDSISSIDTPP